MCFGLFGLVHTNTTNVIVITPLECVVPPHNVSYSHKVVLLKLFCFIPKLGRGVFMEIKEMSKKFGENHFSFHAILQSVANLYKNIPSNFKSLTIQAPKRRLQIKKSTTVIYLRCKLCVYQSITL